MITYVGGVTDTSVNGGALSASLSGLGLQEGDIVFACVCCPTTSDIDLSISGYNEMCDLFTDYGSNWANFYAGYKIMGATPDSSVEVGAFGGAEAGNVLLVYVFRGVDTTTPLDVTPTTAIYESGASLRPLNAPITPVTSGSIVVCAIMNSRTSSTITTSTDPVGYSDLVAAGVSDTRVCTAGICQKDWSGSGAETPGEWTFQYYDYAGITIALRPLATGTDYFKTCSETIAINDTILNKTSKALTEAISIVDSISIQKTLKRTLSETITIADNIDAKKIATRTLSETITIVDTIKMNLSKVFSETISIVDNLSITKTLKRTLSETISIVDSIEKSIIKFKTLAESISIIDSISKRTSRVFSEAVTIADTLSKRLIKIKILSEAITITDSVSIKIGKTFAETISIISSFAAQAYRVARATIKYTGQVLSKLNNTEQIKAKIKKIINN